MARRPGARTGRARARQARGNTGSASLANVTPHSTIREAHTLDGDLVAVGAGGGRLFLVNAPWAEP